MNDMNVAKQMLQHKPTEEWHIVLRYAVTTGVVII